MRAALKESLDTVWGNGIAIEVTSELDNAHSLTTRELAALMVHTMRVLIEEVRGENDREIRTIGVSEEVRHAGEDDRSATLSERERVRYEEMERDRDARADQRSEQRGDSR